MNVHEIELSGYCARQPSIQNLVLGTAGSRGNEQLHVTLGEDWAGLTVQAVFWPCRAEMPLPSSGLLEVPWEATAKPLTRSQGRIVFQGLEDGRTVITTDLSYEVRGHSPVNGTGPAEYTPSAVEQILTGTAQDRAAAEAAAERAEAVAVYPPRFSDSQTWEVWNPNTGEYEDTGVPATGPQGPAGEGVPSVTAADAGKFLRVSSEGVWAAEAISSAEGVSF